MTLANSSDARRKSSTVRVHSCCDFLRSRAGSASLRASLPSWTGTRHPRPASCGRPHRSEADPESLADGPVPGIDLLHDLQDRRIVAAPGPGSARPRGQTMAASPARAGIRPEFVFISSQHPSSRRLHQNGKRLTGAPSRRRRAAPGLAT